MTQESTRGIIFEAVASLGLRLSPGGSWPFHMVMGCPPPRSGLYVVSLSPGLPAISHGHGLLSAEVR